MSLVHLVHTASPAILLARLAFRARSRRPLVSRAASSALVAPLARHPAHLLVRTVPLVITTAALEVLFVCYASKAPLARHPAHLLVTTVPLVLTTAVLEVLFVCYASKGGSPRLPAPLLA